MTVMIVSELFQASTELTNLFIVLGFLLKEYKIITNAYL